MSRKARIRLGVVVGIVGAIAIVITGIDALNRMPYFPQFGVIVIIIGLVTPLFIPMGIRNLNKKYDQDEMLEEWRKSRKRPPGR